ncbi:CdaR family transcriptional regulator, partial [Mycobacterium sp. NAZ190054]|uniref:PucR family transcriptional regulator n=1 Tax=Mycobacterium sp. NAZ190054 TaxID=1747766 RepID=UPI001E4A54F8
FFRSIPFSSATVNAVSAFAAWSAFLFIMSLYLPERALLGDATAAAALEAEVMRPLSDAGPALVETLDAYLDSGGAIEACARKLFVHPNTVRYRLKRIADFTGRDPTVPRDAYVLRVASSVGRLARHAHLATAPATEPRQVPDVASVTSEGFS